MLKWLKRFKKREAPDFFETVWGKDLTEVATESWDALNSKFLEKAIQVLKENFCPECPHYRGRPCDFPCPVVENLSYHLAKDFWAMYAQRN